MFTIAQICYFLRLTFDDACGQSLCSPWHFFHWGQILNLLYYYCTVNPYFVIFMLIFPFSDTRLPFGKNFFQLVVFVCVVILTITPSQARAADALEEKKGALEELQEKEEKYRKLIELKEREQTSINSQVNSLEKQSKTIEKDISTNTQKITTLQDEISVVQDEVDTKLELIEKQKDLLTRIIRNQYDAMRNSEQVDDIFPRSSDRFTLAGSQSQLTEKLGELTKIIIGEKVLLEKTEEELANKRLEVEDLQEQLRQKNSAIEKTKNVKTLDALETKEEQAIYEDRLEDVLEEQLSIQQEIDSLGTTYTGTFSLGDLPSKDDADLSRPVTSPYSVTQGYGKTSFSHHYKGGNHNGVDYSGRFGLDILSAGDGTVLATGDMGRYGYGKWITIDHGNGLVSLYGHLSRVNVSSGESVDGGEKIGVMGTTGFSTGVHLHFTLFVKTTFQIVNSSSIAGIKIPTGATVNPALYY